MEGDRLYPAWLFSLYGMRRGEVLGVREEFLDLDGVNAPKHGFPAGTPTITIFKTRIVVDGEVIEEEPKSKKSTRTLPLSDEQVATIKSYRQLIEKEREQAGAAYENHPQLIVDELGRPIHLRRLVKFSGRF